MKIRKKFQGTIPENKVVDSYTESDSDVYNCNYVNKMGGGIVEIKESLTTYVKQRSIKFANGFMINIHYEYHADAASGSIPVTAEHQRDWLTPFVEFYSVDSSMGKSNKTGWLVAYYPDDTQPLTKCPKYRGASNSTGNLNYYASITAFGRWK